MKIKYNVIQSPVKQFYMFAFQELEEQLAEQKKLLQSVASRGEEILIQQASPSSARYFTHCYTTHIGPPIYDLWFQY